jgi:hypothetical protein
MTKKYFCSPKSLGHVLDGSDQYEKYMHYIIYCKNT